MITTTVISNLSYLMVGIIFYFIIMVPIFGMIKSLNSNKIGMCYRICICICGPCLYFSFYYLYCFEDIRNKNFIVKKRFRIYYCFYLDFIISYLELLVCVQNYFFLFSFINEMWIKF